MSDFWNFIGDPGGYITGVNKEGFGGVKKMLFGDPDAIKKAYDDAAKLSQTGSENIKNFLQGQKGQAQQFYAPIQHMFQAAYGTEGLQAPQMPNGVGEGLDTVNVAMQARKADRDAANNAKLGRISSMYGGR